MKFFTKKTLLITWTASLAVFIFFEINSLSQLCLVEGNYNSLCRNGLLTLSFLGTFLSIVLLPILLTLPLKTAVFDAWKRFAALAIPIVLILTVYIANLDHRGFVDTRPVIYSGLLYGAYFLISLGMIIFTRFKNRG